VDEAPDGKKQVAQYEKKRKIDEVEEEKPLKKGTKRKAEEDAISAPKAGAAKVTTKRRTAGQKKRIPGSLGATIPIRKFEINMAKWDYTQVFYGRRRSGKSFLMRWLLYKMRKVYPRGLCITKTPENGFCKYFIHSYSLTKRGMWLRYPSMQRIPHMSEFVSHNYKRSNTERLCQGRTPYTCSQRGPVH
jgi:hypothetical protein